MGLLDYSRANPWLGDSLALLSQGLLAYGTGNQNALTQLPSLLAQRQQDRRENQRQSRMDERQNQIFQMQVEENQRKMSQEAERQKRFESIIPTLPPELQSIAQATGPDFADLWAKQQVENQFSGPGDAPTIKDFYEGGRVIQKQWNPQAKTWDTMGEGPRWAPDQSSGPDLPSAVQEWQYFNSLPPEKKQEYLTMKRAADWQNLGGQVTLPDPLNPAGAPIATMDKTIPPQDTPEVRGAQAAAVGAAQNSADAAALAAKKEREASTTLDVLSGVEDTIDKATGSSAGALVDMGAAAFGKSTEGAKAIAQLKVIQAKLMMSMPRMEGPQSDRDVNLYREAAGQIGDPTIPGEIKKAAVETIRALQKKYPNATATPAPSPNTDLKSKYGLE